MLRICLSFLSGGRPARAVSVVTGKTATTSRLVLDPPGTPMPLDFDRSHASEPESTKQYACFICGNAVVTLAERLAPVSSSGWPVFTDHIPNAVLLKRVLAAPTSAPLPPTQRRGVPLVDTSSSTRTATGRRAKPSLRLCTDPEAVTFCDGDDFRELSSSARNRTQQARQRLMARNKVVASRSKLVLSSIQVHCAKCDTPLGLLAKHRKKFRLVVNPTSVAPAAKPRKAKQKQSPPT